MASVTPALLTAEEFARLPEPADGSQQELIDGVILASPLPGFPHGVCCSRLVSRLGNYAESNNSGIVLCNNAGIILQGHPDTVLAPDVAYWSKDRLTEVPEGYIEVSPDLAVEVVSPSDAQSRLQKKVLLYLKNGVRMVWLVDPELRIVTVYRALDQSRILEEHDSLSGEDVVPGFSCQVATLFP